MQNNTIEFSALPTWAQKLNLNYEELKYLAAQDPAAALHPWDQFIFDATLEFSNEYQISFEVCCAHVLDLYSQQSVTREDVQKHLKKKFGASLNDPSQRTLPRNCKTIMLVGRTCEGKSTLTNHLATKNVTELRHSARSQTTGARLFVSEACDLNIIDTEGLDGTDTTQTNRELMETLLLQTSYCLEMGASLDAIIVMWCPIKNGKSGLLKTLRGLKETFGGEVMESCIVMIQGNWRRFADDLQLRQPVEEAMKGMHKEFPHVPLIEYDAKGSLEEQLPILKTSIGNVRPYRREYFEKQRRREFMIMVAAFRLKTESGLSEEQKGEFVERYQSQILEATSQREETVKERGSFWRSRETHRSIFTFGLDIITAFIPTIIEMFFG